MTDSTQAEPEETPVASLAKHALVYSIAPLIQRFLALALWRVYTTWLNPAQRGVTQLTDLLFTALIQVSGTNVLAAVVRFYFDQKDERDRRAVVSSAILFLNGVSWTLVGLGLLFRAPLAAFLFETTDVDLVHDDLIACISVVLVTIPFALSSEAAFRYLQIQQRSGLITSLRVGKSTIEMALRVAFLVGFEQGVVGFLLATLIGELLTNLFLTAWVLSRIGLRFSWRVLSPMLAYAAPLVLVGLCQMALNQIDGLMLRQLGPPGQRMDWVGVYSHGYMIGWLVQILVVGSFMQIWQPWIFGVKDAERRAALVTRVSTWALFAVGFSSIGLMLFGREFVRLLSGQAAYWAAYPVVPWVCAAYVFFALNGLSQVPLFIAKRTWPMFWLNLCAVGVKVALSFVLIPIQGFVGAAMATLATFAVLGVCGHVLAHRLVGAKFEHLRMTAMLALVLGVAGTTLWIDSSLSAQYTTTFTPMSAVKAAILVAATALVWSTFLRREERSELLRRMRRE
ncbi:MAG TPA: oligosaccharide flippase family protein [Planctomycetota bacterium]|nr:oligosaccharide flippase family protein [Planctomycetota bacterium]